MIWYCGAIVISYFSFFFHSLLFLLMMLFFIWLIVLVWDPFEKKKKTNENGAKYSLILIISIIINIFDVSLIFPFFLCSEIHLAGTLCANVLSCAYVHPASAIATPSFIKVDLCINQKHFLSEFIVKNHLEQLTICQESSTTNANSRIFPLSSFI